MTVVGRSARRLFGVVFVVGIVAFATAATQSGATDGGSLTRYPYLTDLVGRHVQVNWVTTTAVASGTVTYGKVGTEPCTAHTVAATPTGITVGPTPETMWSASLGGLTRTGSYCYGVLGDGTSLLAADPAPRFHAQVAAGSEKRFSFAVLGDWGAVHADGTNPDQAAVLTQLAASGVRFAVTTGDTAYPDGSQKNYGDLQQTGPDTSGVFGSSFWAKVGSTVPLFNTQGNHGLSSDALVNWPEPRAVASSYGRYRMDRYPSVLGTAEATYPSEWYAFNAGQARFYVLDASWNNANKGSSTIYGVDAAQHWSPTSDEYIWLQHDLATHPAAMRFAFFHFPLYTNNATETSDTYLQGADHLEGMLANAGVDLIFNGHAHIYERNGPSAAGMPVSYVTGTGGGELEPTTACAAPGLLAIGWDPHFGVGSACGTAMKPASPDAVYSFLKVTVRGTTVTVTPTDELGHAFDSQTYDFSSSAA